MWRGTILLMLATGALAAPAGVAQAKPANVSFGEFYYRADRVRIELGDSVTWTNRGDTLHTVTSRRGVPQGFDSDVLEAGQTFTRAFTKPGTYDYLCTLHPFQMSGVVQVGPDTIKPVVSRVAVKVGKATRVSFRLSEAARVQARITRRGKLVRVLSKAGLKRGSKALTSSKALPAGRYRTTVRATDLEGNKAKPVTTSFTVR